MRGTPHGSRLLVKVGPSLGLLGTLIPMGTALASLATGNLDAMAGQMVVAFTTTIIGLACGTARVRDPVACGNTGWPRPFASSASSRNASRPSSAAGA